MNNTRLPGLPTIVALMLAAIVAAAIAIKGPIPVPYEVFKDFQPLIAACVALIGAGCVLYGAKLTHHASMKKIDLDREIDDRDARRQQRGVMLRARYDVWILGQSARDIRKLISGPMPYELDLSLVRLRSTEGIEEAWGKLEEFPKGVSRAFSAIKVEIHNYELTRAEFGDQASVTVAFNTKEAASVKDLMDHMNEIERHCDYVFKALEQEISDS